MQEVVSDNVSKAIDRFDIFRALDDETKQKLKEAGKFHAYAPGQVLVREGDKSGDLFLIESGKVEIKTHTDDKDVVLAELGQGELLGEVPAITGVRRTSTATALEMVNAVILPAELIREIAENNAAFKQAVLKIIETRAVDTRSKTVS